jgi:hypothetical protein
MHIPAFMHKIAWKLRQVKSIRVFLSYLQGEAAGCHREEGAREDQTGQATIACFSLACFTYNG